MHISRNTVSPLSSTSDDKRFASGDSGSVSPAVSDASAADGSALPNAYGILAESWPSLSRALGQYQQNTAERFTQMAYDRVSAGIIRHSDRAQLASVAEALSIRPFDAQLLIACAIRKWALDRRYDPAPSQHAPALSFEYKAWTRIGVRLALIVCTAVILEGIIVWKWLF